VMLSANVQDKLGRPEAARAAYERALALSGRAGRVLAAPQQAGTETAPVEDAER
jgi:hypothetical protein